MRDVDRPLDRHHRLLADEDQPDLGVLADDVVERVDEHVVALLGRDAADVQQRHGLAGAAAVDRRARARRRCRSSGSASACCGKRRRIGSVMCSLHPTITSAWRSRRSSMRSSSWTSHSQCMCSTSRTPGLSRRITGSACGEIRDVHDVAAAAADVVRHAQPVEELVQRRGEEAPVGPAPPVQGAHATRDRRVAIVRDEAVPHPLVGHVRDTGRGAAVDRHVVALGQAPRDLAGPRSRSSRPAGARRTRAGSRTRPSSAASAARAV